MRVISTRLAHGLVVLPLLVGLTGSAQTAPPFAEESSSVTTYEPSAADFPNPERGFYDQYRGWDRVIDPGSEYFPKVRELRELRRQGISLLRVYYLIPEFRGRSLSSEFLATFERQLDRARRAGVKLIPLFAYSFPTGPDSLVPGLRTDAPVGTVLRHIDDLEPTVEQNSDVIAFWDAGFIGPWGEWHTSSSGLVGSKSRYDAANAKTRRIARSLFEMVPRERMITLRYLRHKLDLFTDRPLTEGSAFAGTARARAGAKNDCFLASDDDWGTYYPNDPASIQRQKDFLHQDNLFVPQGGETCNSAADAQPYIGCANAVDQLSYLRFSTINISFEEKVLQGWKDGGCYDQIARRLGYRLELVSSTLPAGVRRGSDLELSFTVENTGFASPYNPRRLELVLRDKTTGRVVRLAVNEGTPAPSDPAADPRFWLPGETTTVDVDVPVPDKLAAGTYEVLLNLPDPEPRLRSRAAYSIRLANLETWEPATGFNSLRQDLTITD